jgi:hypothetical protein
MAKIGTQFHAAPDEILNFIKECSEEFHLHVAILRSFPTFSVNILHSTDGVKSISNSKTIRICLYQYEPDLDANDQSEFFDKNPECLTITIGKYHDNQLGESSIGSLVQDANTLKMWKKIITKFKSNTYTGAWVVNSLSGEKAFYKHHIYTEGARKLFLEGVKVVPFGGWNHYILSESL